MPIERKTDLRVQKTKEAIYRTFQQMVSEMDADKITVKALTKRARIHYKTFYFASDFGTAWILSTPNMPMPDDSVYITNELGLEDMGRYGIEHNEFEIYKVTHLN